MGGLASVPTYDLRNTRANAAFAADMSVRNRPESDRLNLIESDRNPPAPTAAGASTPSRASVPFDSGSAKPQLTGPTVSGPTVSGPTVTGPTVTITSSDMKLVNSIVFAQALSAALQTADPLGRFTELTKSGHMLAKNGLLDTNIGEEEGVVPPLLSLAKYRRTGSLDASWLQLARKTVSDLLNLIEATGGVRSIVNDRRYAVVAVSYQNPPYLLYEHWLRIGSYLEQIDWNIPDPNNGGKTVWMLAAEYQQPQTIIALLRDIFPRIDLEQTDADGRNPFRLCTMNDDEARPLMLNQYLREYGQATDTVTETAVAKHTRGESKLVLLTARDALLPMYKRSLKIHLAAQLVGGGFGAAHGPLPAELCAIIETYLRL